MNNIIESGLISQRGNLKYLKELRELSRKNRKSSTKTENIVWYQILNNRKTGFKFLRQKSIDRFILDFYCKELLLAIEIDGDSHNEKRNYDKERDSFFNNLNIETVRFSNKDILNNLNGVQKEIMSVINKRENLHF